MAVWGLGDSDRGVVPAPALLVAFFLLGSLAVIQLPSLARHLPHPGRIAQAQYAATAVGIFLLTVAYLYLASRVEPAFDLPWTLWSALYATGLVIVKFILSPTAFDKTGGASLDSFVTTGLLVMPLYLGACGVMYVVARRADGDWTLSSKVWVALGLAVLAVVTRLVAAVILGTASQYLDGFIGTGLILPILVAGASFALMQSFDRARPSLKPALGVAVTLVVAQHVLWALYMYRLF